MMRTMELKLNDILFDRLEYMAHRAGVSMPEFVLQLLRRSLGELSIKELEQQEIDAYKRLPVTIDEFGNWESEQVWGEE